MAEMQTKTISFHEVNSKYPTQSEIKVGVYALNKLSGDWVRIPRDCFSVPTSIYSVYAPVSAFPGSASNPYGEKYNDLVKAKEIINENKWSGSGDELGKAIYLIKRFLDKNAKV